MNTNRLRQLWSVIEETHAHLLQELNDSDLLNQLLNQLDIQQPLSHEEAQAVLNYLRVRLLLIREMG